MPDPKELTAEFYGGMTDAIDEEEFKGLDRGDSLTLAEPAPEPAAEVAAEPAAEVTEEPAAEVAEATDSETPVAEAEEAPQKEPAIPKSRFDQVNQARKEAEAKLAQLEAKLQGEKGAAEAGANAEYDFDAAEARYMEAVLDGKSDEAKQIRREIRAAERAEYEALAVEKANQITTATKVQAEIDVVIARAEAEVPELNPANESTYRADVVEEIAAYYGTRLNLGDSPAVAMQRAIDAMVKVHGLKAPPPPPPPPPPPKPKAVPDVKKTAAKVEVAKKAPPTLAAAGVGGDKGGLAEIDINSLSDKDLDALPASTLARLRGDYIAA